MEIWIKEIVMGIWIRKRSVRGIALRLGYARFEQMERGSFLIYVRINFSR